MNQIPRIEDELEGIALGDKRLDRRAVMIAKRASDGPGKSFPKMVKDASELEAFYRFFQNEEIEASTVLEPHRRAAVARCNEVPVVRVAHDTTKFSFMGEREGLGPVGKGGGQGFHWHASLAISGDELRTPLGVLTASSFIDKDRPEPIGLKKIKGRYETHPAVPPTPKVRREQKRSARWFQAVQEVEGRHSSARLIHV